VIMAFEARRGVARRTVAFVAGRGGARRGWARRGKAWHSWLGLFESGAGCVVVACSDSHFF